MMNTSILLAKIGAAHGIKGEVRVIPYGDPQMLDRYGKLHADDGTAFKIKRMRTQKNALVVKFEGINSRSEAEALNGIELYVDRNKLPPTEDEDEFYLSDLIGLEVRNLEGSALGKVKDVPNFGADDMLEIQPLSGGSYYLPFSRSVVPRIDLEHGVVTVDPPQEVSERDENERDSL